MDEVFGRTPLCSDNHSQTAGQRLKLIAGTADYVLWFAKIVRTVNFEYPFLRRISN